MSKSTGLKLNSRFPRLPPLHAIKPAPPDSFLKLVEWQLHLSRDSSLNLDSSLCISYQLYLHNMFRTQSLTISTATTVVQTLSWIILLASLLTSLFLPHLPAPARRVNAQRGNHLFNKYLLIEHLPCLKCETSSSICSMFPE